MYPSLSEFPLGFQFTSSSIAVGHSWLPQICAHDRSPDHILHDPTRTLSEISGISWNLDTSMNLWVSFLTRISLIDHANISRLVGYLEARLQSFWRSCRLVLSFYSLGSLLVSISPISQIDY